MAIVKVRFIYEAEYEAEPGSGGYEDARTLEECLEIDRNAFLTDDHAGVVDAFDAVPIALEVVR